MKQVGDDAPLHPYDGIGRERWLALAVLFTARVSFGFQFQSLAVLAPFVASELPLDHATLGFLTGVYMLPGIAVALPGGVLGQRFGEIRVTLFGLLLMMAGGILVAVSDSAAQAAVGRVVSGGGAVLLNVCLTKMLTDWFIGRELVLAAGVLASSWSTGVGLSLLLLPLAAAAISVDFAMMLPALLSALALVLVALAYRAPENAPESRSAFRLELSGREWRSALLSGAVWGFFNVGYVAFLVFAPELLTRAGDSVSGAAATVSLVNWAIILTLPLGGHLARIFGSAKGVMIASFLLLAALSIGLPVGLHAATACLLFGLVSGPVAGLTLALPGPALQARNRAAGMGAFFMVYYACMAALLPLAGLARDVSQSASAPLVFAAGMMAAATAALIAFRRARRP